MAANLLTLLTAFGLGSIVTALVQSWMSRRSHIESRNFQERKEVYVGLLEAYHKAAVEGTDRAAKEFAYWQMRCNLVAPPKVRLAISDIVETNEDLPARHAAHNILMEELRKDLGVVSAS